MSMMESVSSGACQPCATLVLGYWVGVQRPFHLSLSLTALPMVTQDPGTEARLEQAVASVAARALSGNRARAVPRRVSRAPGPFARSTPNHHTKIEERPVLAFPGWLYVVRRRAPQSCASGEPLLGAPAAVPTAPSACPSAGKSTAAACARERSVNPISWPRF